MSTTQYRKRHGRRKRSNINLFLVFIIFVLSVIIILLSVGKADRFTGAAAEPVANEARSTTASGNDSAVSLTNKMLHVDYINQDDYPTGCESVSAVMALRYAGYDISVDEFIDEYLPLSDLYADDGTVHCESPYEYFLGNPRDGFSYGCYSPVIVRAASRIAGAENVKNLNGASMDELSEYIDRSIPVIIWATINMAESYVSEQLYVVSSGEYLDWIAPEHCLLLIGYDEGNYFFNDPYNNNGIVSYEKSLVESRYREMGSQAVAIIG